MAGPLILSNRMQRMYDSFGKFGDTVEAARNKKLELQRQSSIDAMNKETHDQALKSGEQSLLSGQLSINEQQRKADEQQNIKSMSQELAGFENGQTPFGPQLQSGPMVMADAGEEFKDRLRARIDTAMTGKLVTTEDLKALRDNRKVGAEDAAMGLQLKGSQLKNDEAQRGVYGAQKTKYLAEAEAGRYALKDVDGDVIKVDAKTGDVSSTGYKPKSSLTTKSLLNVKSKLTTLEIAKKQLGDIRKAAENLSSLNAGPVLTGHNSLTRGGESFDKAVAGFKSTLRTLTRTPGEGANSDWEGRLAMAPLPERTSYASTREQSIVQLEDMVTLLETGYRGMAPQEDDKDTDPLGLGM